MVRINFRVVTLNLVLVVVASTFTLAMAEGVVRVVAPQQLIRINPHLWHPADTVGWLRRPNVATKINTGERTVQIFTDERGFRIGHDRDRTGDVHVLLVGDSFMEALQVEHDQTLAGLLEARLSAKLGGKVVVHNTGVSGWQPDQYFLHARSLLEALVFDLVITSIYVGNDAVKDRHDYVPPLVPVQRKDFRVPRRIRRPELIDALLHPANDRLEARSQLFVLFKNGLPVVRMRFGLTPAYFPAELLVSEAGSRRWAVTAEICRDIRDEAAARGVPTIFVLVPAHFQVYDDAFDRYVRGFGIDPAQVDLDQPNRLLMKAFLVHDLNVLDALPVFRAARHGPRLYGRVDTHLSPAGHAQLGDLLMGPVASLLGGPAVEDET